MDTTEALRREKLENEIKCEWERESVCVRARVREKAAMMFKGKFFSSSKKSSDSSSPDGGSSSPRSTIFGSASRFEKKKVRSSREDPLSTSVSGGRHNPAKELAKVQQQQQHKKKEKEKEKGREKEGDQKGKEASMPSPTSGASFYPKKIWKGTGFKEGGTVTGSSLSPILASSLGLNRIKTRSGPLPQEAFRESRITGIGSSNLRREGSGSTSSSSATAISSSSAFAGAGKGSVRKKDARGLEKVPEAHFSSWAGRGRSQFDRTLPKGSVAIGLSCCS